MTQNSAFKWSYDDEIFSEVKAMQHGDEILDLVVTPRNSGDFEIDVIDADVIVWRGHVTDVKTAKRRAEVEARAYMRR